MVIYIVKEYDDERNNPEPSMAISLYFLSFVFTELVPAGYMLRSHKKAFSYNQKDEEIVEN